MPREAAIDNVQYGESGQKLDKVNSNQVRGLIVAQNLNSQVR